MVTTYFLNNIMGNVFESQTTPSLPNAYYLGLSSTAPTLAGGNVTEPSGNGYARVELTTLSAPTNGVVKNSQDIIFPESTGSWGTLTHFVLYNAETGGDLLMYGTLSASRSIEKDTVIRINANNLVLTLENE